jgi:RNA recognition motif-containing protein
MKNIYVSNLSFRITNEDLQTAFAEYGEVLSAKVISDNFSGKSRGFGFVEMKNDEEADKAIEELNNAEFDGKVISVAIAKPKSERKPGGSGGFGRSGGFNRNNDRQGGGGGYNKNRY